MTPEQRASRIAEIDTRLAAIPGELDTGDLNQLEAETRSLTSEKSSLIADTEKREQLLADIVNNKTQSTIIEKSPEQRKENKHMDFTNMNPEEIRSTEEYRIAWIRNIQGRETSELEKRALTGGAYVVPDTTANKIVEKLVDTVPLLNEIDLMRVKGNVSIAVQSVAPTPTLVAGGSGLSEATTTLVEVTLGYYSLSTLVRIGADLASMAVPAFETWLTGKIAEQLAYKIEYYIIKGSGSSQPKGIDYAFQSSAWADGTDAVDWAAGTLGSADIDEAIGLLPGAYDANSKFLMSKKTFYTSVIGLTDTNNVKLVEREGGKFILRGYPVLFSDQVDAGDIFFGDFRRGMVGNLSNDFNVERARNLAYNSYDYLGWCSFDCKPTGILCIVKIAADIA